MWCRGNLPSHLRAADHSQVVTTSELKVWTQLLQLKHICKAQDKETDGFPVRHLRHSHAKGCSGDAADNIVYLIFFSLCI